jgi:tellurite resistance protein TerC
MDFLIADWLGTPVWFWLAFIGLVITLTAFDLGVLHKEDREMGIAESLKLSAFYIAIALAFGVWVWMQKGADLGMKYYTGFFIEKALSIDNVFVISLIFTYFAIPRMYQYRALLWGIVAVIVLRGLMIAGGAALVENFYWTLYLFAAFLIATGVKMLRTLLREGARQQDRQAGARGNPAVPRAGGDQPRRPGLRGRFGAGDLRDHH